MARDAIGPDEGGRGRSPRLRLLRAGRPKAPAPVATRPPPARAFEPQLPFADAAPRFQPASSLPAIDRAHLLEQLGDERYWGLLGADALPLYSFKGATTAEGLVVPSFASGAHQHHSPAASFWDREGRLRGYLEGLEHIVDVAGAAEAPFIAFATATYGLGEPRAHGVWLFNTRAARFYARRFCAEGVARGVSLSADGTRLAARCADHERDGDRWREARRRVEVWDLRAPEPRALCSLPLDEITAEVATGIAGAGSSVLLSPDGGAEAVLSGDRARIVRVAGCREIADAPAGALIHLDDAHLTLRQGRWSGELVRVRVAGGASETLATDVTDARFDPLRGRLYWASGTTLAGMTTSAGEGGRLGPIELGAVASHREPDEISHLDAIPGGVVVARMLGGSVIEVADDLGMIMRSSKLPGSGAGPEGAPAVFAWTADNEVTLRVHWAENEIAWTPGGPAEERRALDDEGEEAPPSWSFRCDALPKKGADPHCVDPGPYILGGCERMTPTAGVHVAARYPELDENDQPKGPGDTKVFHVRYDGEVHTTTWTFSDPLDHCAVSTAADRIVVAMGSRGVACYRAEDGEKLWENGAVEAHAILLDAAAGVVASLGDGRLAWLDPASGAVRRVWQAHRIGCGLAAALDPGGTRLATTACDDTLRLWRLTPP
jgi:hypothetical protein